MPHANYWVVTNKVLLTQIGGDISLNEIQYLNRYYRESLLLNRSRIHYIIDIQGIQAHPLNFRKIVQQMNISRLPNEGYTVVFGGNILLQALVALIDNSTGWNLLLADDLASAARKLCRLVPDLPPFEQWQSELKLLDCSQD